MQIPPIEHFRQEGGTEYGPAWSADPEGVAFTLMLPDAEPVWEDGGWEPRPHEPSYRLAHRAVAELDSLKEQALAYLAGIVNFEKLAMEGEPFVIGIHCDARTHRVTLALEWTKELYCRFSVTFSWRIDHPQLPDRASPVRMAFWNR